MVTNYRHHLYPKQSEFVKYRGKSGQIDVKDTIISILANKPGLTLEELKDMIYHPDFNKSRFYNVTRALESLLFEGSLYKEEASEQYYLQNDAISHDIAKTQASMDKLTELGLSREQVVFLSSGIIMAGEQARAESEDRNYHTKETVASSPAVVPPVVKVEEVVNEQVDLVVEPIVGFQIEDQQISFSGIPHEELEPIIPNPFENMSEDNIAQLKLIAIQELVEEKQAEELEAARLLMEAADAAAEAERKAEEARQQLELQNKELAYKNKLTGIKSATSLLGLDVEIKLPELKGQVVGTILELRPDSVLFLIVFSKDDQYPEGSVHTIFYKDNLSYKIMA